LPKGRIIRWGSAAYETEAALGYERAGVEKLGYSWRLWQAGRAQPPLDEAEALIVHSSIPVTAEVVRLFAGQMIITTTSGHDHIDLKACRQKGIYVVRLAQARRDAVVSFCLGAMFSLAHRLPHLMDAARGGHWARADLPEIKPFDLLGRTVAVVGLGVIGRRMATLLSDMGITVLGIDPFQKMAGVRNCTLAQALPVADVISLHCSLSESSVGLLGREELLKVKPGALLINTARGPVLDLEAAIELVQGGYLGGLAADVFDEEPFVELEKARIPGVLLTPHAAGYSLGLGRRVAAGVINVLKAWDTGQALPYRLT